mmetsp:Transcript_61542/g.199200  ORF Transcript_61542/g.199200 Transcript_61542/m.199200 type:complete len:107 (+) Transcript_61542:70-390(+)
MSSDKLWASWKSYCLKPERTWPSTAPFKEREACKDGSTHAKYMQSNNSTPDAMKSRRLAALSSAPNTSVCEGLLREGKSLRAHASSATAAGIGVSSPNREDILPIS